MRKERKRLDVDLPAETRDALTVEAQVKSTTVTALATTYIQRGLSQEQAERLESQSLPLLREAVQAEMRQMAAQIRHDLRAELDQFLKELRQLLSQSTNRQAALQVKALREDEITRRLLVLLAERLLSATQAQELSEQATAATSRHLAATLGEP